MSLILITRPLDRAATLARQLESLGYSCLSAPMLTIRPTGLIMPAGSPVQAVMLTSANALSVLSPAVITALSDYPCFCVGAKTAAAAEASGFKRVLHSDGDGADLARLIAATLPTTQAPILHIAADAIDSRAQQVLERCGFSVTQWKVYAALPVDNLEPATLAALKEGKVGAVVSFSARSAEHLCQLIDRNGLRESCRGIVAVGLSQNIGDVLKSLPWRAVAAASAPTEAAVIACLKQHLPVARMPEIPLPPPAEVRAEENASAKPAAPRSSTSRTFKQHALTFALGVICCLALTIYGLSWFEKHPTASPAASTMVRPLPPMASATSVPSQQPVPPSQGIVLPAPSDVAATINGSDSSSTDKDATLQRQAQDIAKLQNDVLSLSTSLAALQGEIKNSNDLEGRMQTMLQSGIAAALDFTRLREVAATGRPFGAQLSRFRADIEASPFLQSTGAKLTALDYYAANGVPSLAALREQFDLLRPDAARASAMATAQSWWERLFAQLKGLVIVRRLHDGKNTDAFTKVDQDLAGNDVQAAALDAAGLPPETEPVFKDWRAKLQDRVTLDTQLDIIADRLSGHTVEDEAPAPTAPATAAPADTAPAETAPTTGSQAPAPPSTP